MHLKPHLTYSNVMATAAVFIALGGGAYAVSTNSVKSKHIVNDEVKSADVREESLNAGDIDSSSFAWEELPVGGVSAAQVRDIGGDGDTLFGPVAGRLAAQASPEDAYMGVPFGTRADNLFVYAEDPVTGGQTREFSLVAYPNLVGGAGAGSVILECTLQTPPVGGAGPQSCDDKTPTSPYNGVYVIRIESTGAGLDPNDDAYVGVSMSAPHDAEDP
jgi:hypothetical protein